MAIYDFNPVEIIEISIMSFPSLVILTSFYTGRMLLVDFIEILTKSTKDDTNYTHQK